MPTLESTLKEHFGFDTFRPLQREIVEASLAGSDVVAILPTGGGKSLCYQLPALMREGLTVVISPLIALMKDQVDGLREDGISAAFLNSSLNEEQSRATWRGLYSGEIKILYLSPERLLMDGMLEKLETLKLGFLAVDEAHCISAWGHDFRPEYRGLRRIRELYPQIPIMALTATATDRVRTDIVQMLGLRGPQRFVGSFNRANLSYRVLPRKTPLRQIEEILADHKGESAIVYCLSRAKTEAVAEALEEQGIKAAAYHAGLDPKVRKRRQEHFVADKVDVIVATIAFGMGIDKPDVRCVIHHDLPKNIESYYQETGRAGRDGLPSECVLLYDSADAAKIYSFIEQLSDPAEQEVARAQLGVLHRYAESAECRRVVLLRYFGETYADEQGNPRHECGACDNCLTPRTEIDGTQIAQKILSCVVRVRQHSGFAVGFHHLVDVLVGADTEKVRSWGHDTLSTYGIGREIARTDWLYYARECERQGFLAVNRERFNVVEVTATGMAFLKERGTVQLRAPIATARLTKEKRVQQRKTLGEKQYDEDLFERLRQWRLSKAQERGIPAYMVFSDATLQALSSVRPKNEKELASVSGIGEKKLAQYGEEILMLLG